LFALCQEIVNDPCLCIEGVSSHDLIQGELGNCWMVAAFACIAVHKSLWHQVRFIGTVQTFALPSAS
jgi:hypothetical protein